MSRVRNRDTDIERAVRSELHRRGLRFRKHLRSLPGSPDIAFPRARVAVFIDGDFWHGYRFPLWRDELPPFWQIKIATNRARDQRNHRRLREQGWQVLRLWQHQVKADPVGSAERVHRAVEARLNSPDSSPRR
jgi:DNA mismatch endonuclease, patch repair protein